MLHMGSVMMASTYFVFLHPEVFVQWSMFVGSIGAIFHWLVIHDDKVPDARFPA